LNREPTSPYIHIQTHVNEIIRIFINSRAMKCILPKLAIVVLEKEILAFGDTDMYSIKIDRNFLF